MKHFVLVLLLASAPLAGVARAEDPPAKAASKASAGAATTASPKQAPRKAAPAQAGTRAEPSVPSASGATETVALEIVAKAPKPIPPVELDMLQLRLMLTDLKASFTDEIDEALFREPF